MMMMMIKKKWAFASRGRETNKTNFLDLHVFNSSFFLSFVLIQLFYFYIIALDYAGIFNELSRALISLAVSLSFPSISLFLPLSSFFLSFYLASACMRIKMLSWYVVILWIWDDINLISLLLLLVLLLLLLLLLRLLSDLFLFSCWTVILFFAFDFVNSIIVIINVISINVILILKIIR